MIGHASTLDRPAPPQAWNVGAIAAVLALMAIGYVGASNLWLTAAAAGAIAMAAWAAVAVRHPRMAIAASLAALLVAGTKFRLRDATESLSGVMDWQIVLELGLYGVVAVAVLAIGAFGRYRRKPLNRGEILILAYTALALLSTVWSEAPALTFVRAVQLGIIACVVALSVRVVSPSRAMWTACSALVVYVILGALSTFVAPPANAYERDETYFRFAWFAVHPITAATLAAMAALGVLSASFFPRAGNRRVMGVPRILVLTPLVAILILTSTRGPLLAFAAGAGVLVLMRTAWIGRLALYATAGLAVFVYLAAGADFRQWIEAAAANRDSAIADMFFRGHTAERVLGLNGRLELWDYLGHYIAANPVLGHGFQASRAILLDTATWAAYAHNALLQAMLDLGLVGTAALIALVAAGVIGALRTPMNQWLRAVLASLMVFLVLNSVTSESFAGPPGFEMLMLLLCIACAGPARRAAATSGEEPEIGQ